MTERAHASVDKREDTQLTPHPHRQVLEMNQRAGDRSRRGGRTGRAASARQGNDRGQESGSPFRTFTTNAPGTTYANAYANDHGGNGGRQRTGHGSPGERQTEKRGGRSRGSNGRSERKGSPSGGREDREAGDNDGKESGGSPGERYGDGQILGSDRGKKRDDDAEEDGPKKNLSLEEWKRTLAKTATIFVLESDDGNSRAKNARGVLKACVMFICKAAAGARVAPVEPKMDAKAVISALLLAMTDDQATRVITEVMERGEEEELGRDVQGGDFRFVTEGTTAVDIPDVVDYLRVAILNASELRAYAGQPITHNADAICHANLTEEARECRVAYLRKRSLPAGPEGEAAVFLGCDRYGVRSEHAGKGTKILMQVQYKGRAREIYFDRRGEYFREVNTGMQVVVDRKVSDPDIVHAGLNWRGEASASSTLKRVSTLKEMGQQHQGRRSERYRTSFTPSRSSSSAASDSRPPVPPFTHLADKKRPTPTDDGEGSASKRKKIESEPTAMEIEFGGEEPAQQTQGGAAVEEPAQQTQGGAAVEEPTQQGQGGATAATIAAVGQRDKVVDNLILMCDEVLPHVSDDEVRHGIAIRMQQPDVFLIEDFGRLVRVTDGGDFDFLGWGPGDIRPAPTKGGEAGKYAREEGRKRFEQYAKQHPECLPSIIQVVDAILGGLDGGGHECGECQCAKHVTHAQVSTIPIEKIDARQGVYKMNPRWGLYDVDPDKLERAAAFKNNEWYSPGWRNLGSSDDILKAARCAGTFATDMRKLHGTVVVIEGEVATLWWDDPDEEAQDRGFIRGSQPPVFTMQVRKMSDGTTLRAVGLDEALDIRTEHNVKSVKVALVNDQEGAQKEFDDAQAALKKEREEAQAAETRAKETKKASAEAIKEVRTLEDEKEERDEGAILDPTTADTGGAAQAAIEEAKGRERKAREEHVKAITAVAKATRRVTEAQVRSDATKERVREVEKRLRTIQEYEEKETTQGGKYDWVTTALRSFLGRQAVQARATRVANAGRPFDKPDSNGDSDGEDIDMASSSDDEGDEGDDGEGDEKGDEEDGEGGEDSHDVQIDTVENVPADGGELIPEDIVAAVVNAQRRQASVQKWEEVFQRVRQARRMFRMDYACKSHGKGDVREDQTNIRELEEVREFGDQLVGAGYQKVGKWELAKGVGEKDGEFYVTAMLCKSRGWSDVHHPVGVPGGKERKNTGYTMYRVTYRAGLTYCEFEDKDENRFVAVYFHIWKPRWVWPSNETHYRKLDLYDGFAKVNPQLGEYPKGKQRPVVRAGCKMNGTPDFEIDSIVSGGSPFHQAFFPVKSQTTSKLVAWIQDDYDDAKVYTEFNNETLGEAFRGGTGGGPSSGKSEREENVKNYVRAIEPAVAAGSRVRERSDSGLRGDGGYMLSAPDQWAEEPHIIEECFTMMGELAKTVGTGTSSKDTSGKGGREKLQAAVDSIVTTMRKTGLELRHLHHGLEGHAPSWGVADANVAEAFRKVEDAMAIDLTDDTDGTTVTADPVASTGKPMRPKIPKHRPVRVVVNKKIGGEDVERRDDEDRTAAICKLEGLLKEIEALKAKIEADTKAGLDNDDAGYQAQDAAEFQRLVNMIEDMREAAGWTQEQVKDARKEHEKLNQERAVGDKGTPPEDRGGSDDDVTEAVRGGGDAGATPIVLNLNGPSSRKTFRRRQGGNAGGKQKEGGEG